MGLVQSTVNSLTYLLAEFFLSCPLHVASKDVACKSLSFSFQEQTSKTGILALIVSVCVAEPGEADFDDDDDDDDETEDDLGIASVEFYVWCVQEIRTSSRAMVRPAGCEMHSLV